MNFSPLHVSLFITLLLVCCNARAVVREDFENTLLLISIDGFRPEYLERGLTPTLELLANEGVMAESMMPQFPSLTFPNHYCMVTGRYPVNHGIVHNRFYDPLLKKSFSYTNETENDPRWWLSEPIWNTIQRHNKKSACMFWPGSDVEILGKRPNHSFVYDEKVSNRIRINKVIEWLELPSAKRPSLITLYFSVVDAAGHKFGPNSRQLREALSDVDAAINYLICRLKGIHLFSKINMVIVSDHGMIETKSNPFLIIDSFVDTKKIKWFEAGPVATIIPKDIDDIEWFYIKLKDSPECQQSLFEVYFKEDLPAEFNYSRSPRVPPLILIAKPGYYFTSLDIINRKRENVFVRGQHGYPVSRENRDIHAIFLAHGPKFPKKTRSFELTHKRLPIFSNLDLFSLFVYVLNIKEEPRDGTEELVKTLKNYELQHPENGIDKNVT